MRYSQDYTTHNSDGWSKYLSHLVDKPAKALEVGCYEGRSSVWFLDNILTHKDSTLTCVDCWNNLTESIFDHNIVNSGHSTKVCKIKMMSERALRYQPISRFDFAYIDGCHEGLNVIEDGILAFRLIKSGGILIFDDYLWKSDKRHKMPKPAIDAFLELAGHLIEVQFKGWQVIVKKL